VKLASRYIQLEELDVKTGNPCQVYLSDATVCLLQQAKLPLGATTVAYALRRKWQKDSVEPGRKLKPAGSTGQCNMISDSS
jgi:hypothetical protein